MLSSRKQLSTEMGGHIILFGGVLFYVAVLSYSQVSGQICTNDGFLDTLNVDSYDPSRLVPLLGRHETFGREQWIFFDLRFTCRGTLTKWIFRGLPDQDIGVEITTWRLNTRSSFFTSYDRVSTTERNIERPNRNGAVFTYELLSPVEVLPGDVVGVEMGFTSFGGTSNNVIALNTSRTGSNSLSYRTSGSGPSFILQSPSNVQERDIVPLIQAVVEPVQESTTAMAPSTDSPTTALSTDSPTIEMALSTDSPTTAMALSTDSPTTEMAPSTDSPTTEMVLSTDSVQTVDASTMLPTATVVRPDRRDRSQSGKNPTVTIVAGVCGGITGILIIAILSVCIACITKRVQVHVHYDGEKKPDNGHRENTPNSSGTLVQMNTAYKQEAPTRIATSGLSNGSSMQHNLAYGTQNQLHEGMEAGSIIGDYERMSGYTVFRHGNQIHRGEETISHLALPMTYITTDQPYYTGEYDDEHSYEHIR